MRDGAVWRGTVGLFLSPLRLPVPPSRLEVGLISIAQPARQENSLSCVELRAPRSAPPASPTRTNLRPPFHSPHHRDTDRESHWPPASAPTSLRRPPSLTECPLTQVPA